VLKLVPTPASLAARALPGGIPLVRDQLRTWSGLDSSALDPHATPGDPGLFGPDSPTWDVVGQPAQTLAGLRAALLQALSAPIVTATDATGTFAHDFGGRVARTGAFVQRQNLGSLDEVYRSARRVRGMHRVVAGTGPCDVAYDAGDPHQQAWVSMTLTDSFLVMVERYGTGPLTAARADRFVAEQSTHGALLDPRVDLDELFADPEQRAALQAGRFPLPLIEEGELPTTVEGLRSRMRARAGDLVVTDHTRRLIDAAVQLRGLPSAQKAAIRPFLLATLATVPDALHELLAPGRSRVEEHLAAQAVQTPLALMALLLGPSRAVAVARGRVARG
jgi:uncharacterized protein (DUF2236 family)